MLLRRRSIRLGCNLFAAFLTSFGALIALARWASASDSFPHKPVFGGEKHESRDPPSLHPGCYVCRQRSALRADGIRSASADSLRLAPERRLVTLNFASWNRIA